MAKEIFLAGTTGFWSYERSDTLVRTSVNMSGEKSETLVRYTKQNHTFTMRKKDKNHIPFPIPKPWFLILRLSNLFMIGT